MSWKSNWNSLFNNHDIGTRCVLIVWSFLGCLLFGHFLTGMLYFWPYLFMLLCMLLLLLYLNPFSPINLFSHGWLRRPILSRFSWFYLCVTLPLSLSHSTGRFTTTWFACWLAADLIPPPPARIQCPACPNQQPNKLQTLSLMTWWLVVSSYAQALRKTEGINQAKFFKNEENQIEFTGL